MQESAPLLELERKGVKWSWEMKHEAAFARVKKTQRDELNAPRIVTMASRTLKVVEFNYFTTELELLAIIWALMKFRTFLLGAEILSETEHKALCYLLTCRFLNSRLTRWRLAIQDYDFKIKYIERPRNYIADTLSRMPVKVTEAKERDDASIAMILARKPDIQLQKDIKNIHRVQRSDPRINQIIL